MEKLLTQLVADLENLSINFAALEQVVFKTHHLAPGEYRKERELQALKLKNHFDELRMKVAALPR